MSVAFRDDFTPALRQLARNMAPARRRVILQTLANQLVNQTKRNIEAERNYDQTPMQSPAQNKKFGGRFAENYNWRYRPGYQLATERKAKGRKVKQRSMAIDKRGYAKERLRVRRRIAVTEASKQLQDTGGTIKSIDILSLSCNGATVGPKTGHGQKILEVHELRKKGATRYPMGITDEWAKQAQEFTLSELMKGV